MNGPTMYVTRGTTTATDGCVALTGATPEPRDVGVMQHARCAAQSRVEGQPLVHRFSITQRHVPVFAGVYLKRIPRPAFTCSDSGDTLPH